MAYMERLSKVLPHRLVLPYWRGPIGLPRACLMTKMNYECLYNSNYRKLRKQDKYAKKVTIKP